MNSELYGFIGTLVGTIVGASSSIFATLITNKGNSRNQRRIENFKNNLIVKELQRENCMQAQETMLNLLRFTSLHLLDIINAEKNSNSPVSFDEKVNEKCSENIRKLNLITQRFSNRKLADQIIEFRSLCSEFIMIDDKTQGFNLMSEVKNKYEIAFDKIGEELRKNY
ncbi:hypothetical protein [Zunongwangia sp. HGR-M22]|uniref:hypothetical protein n=1 Tax=Zunongwangia sp. HGR-M22 TaxID=3015168 RepID=UPI0022DE7E78|nr:hypothetical protein [Zunongwangia sp. HGR-M22]WBL25096.1 hypothetical protein PBT91_14480 [Zunongwangia sp. HGR-M22]